MQLERKEKVEGIRKKYLDLWSALSGWRLFLFYTLHYTLVFAVLQYFVFSEFYQTEKAFIWTADGMPQHFTKLVYLSQTIRTGIEAFLSGEGWNIPLYDFRLGYAKHELMQLELIQLLAVLWPWDKIDILSDLLVLLRYYLIGLSFSVFGFYWKQKPMPILLGAISYAFCGFSLYAGVRHPFFMAPMIYLPLLLIGTEEILKKRRPYLLIVMVFLSLTSTVYFSCMLAILVVIYAAVRFFDIYKEMRWHEFGQMIIRLAIGGGTGVLLSGIVSVPVFLQLIGTGRVGRDIASLIGMLKYSSAYYQKFIGNFMMGAGDIGSWTCLGLSVLAIPAVLALFVQKDKTKVSLRKFFILLTLMMCIPFAAYVFSGFNTFSNRWCFAYAFCISTIIMVMLPWFVDSNHEEYKLVSIGSGIYIIVCYYLLKRSFIRIDALLLLALTLFLIGISRCLKEKKKTMVQAICFFMVFVSVYHTSYLQYDKEQSTYLQSFAKQEAPYKYYGQSQYGSFAKSEAKKADNPFYRVSGGSIDRPSMNASFYYDINGISAFPSAGLNLHYLDWKKDLEVAGRYVVHIDFGSDARTLPLAQQAVKYYMLRDGKKGAVPYGLKEVERIENNKNTDVLYENQYALPIGYTYEQYLSTEDYEELPVLKKQEAQMQAVVLEKQPSFDTIKEVTDLQYLSIKKHPRIIESKGVAWKNATLKVTEENATMKLAFEAVPNAETYVHMINFELPDGSGPNRWNVKAETKTVSTNSNFCAESYMYTHGLKSQLLNLGYSEEGYTTCTLTFAAKGTFLLEDIQIAYQPMDKYPEQINALREEVLENVETNWRGLTGEISVSKDKILCLSIPYDKGWKAYVDGERVELYQANTAFMALELEKGDHVVELKYTPSGMVVGMVLTAAGLASLAGIIIYNRKKK